MPSSALWLLLVPAQAPSVVDTTPEPPPTAAIPSFVDVAPQIGSKSGPGFDDPGTGRGQAWVDIVGPGLTDPALPGPPDGIPDLVQLNSNSPSFPIGSGPLSWTIAPVGDVHRPCLVYRSEPGGSLTEMAGAMSAPSGSGFGLEFPGGSPWGIGAGDTDGDGDTDLVVACGGFNTDSPNALLRNNGDGTFAYTTPPGAPYQASFDAVLFDPDRDGDLDLYIANGHEGLTQLYSGNPNPDPVDRFYVNDGSAVFTEDAAGAGLDLKSSSLAAVTTDLDLDGNTDLVVSCFKQLNKVFYSRGDGTFSFMLPEGSAAGAPLSLDGLVADVDFPGSEDFPSGSLQSLAGMPLLGAWAMPVEAADFNGDGWTDLFFGVWSFQLEDDDPTSAEGAEFMPYERSFLYLNVGDVDGDGRGEGIFNEVAEEVGLDHVGGCMGAAAGDFNGDGWADLYIGGGGPQLGLHVEEDYLYINEPSAWPADFKSDPFQPHPKAFWEVGALAGTYLNTEMSHGTNVWRANSGRIDLVIGNGGPAQFDEGQANRYFRNEGNQDGSANLTWAVELSESVSAPGAPGTRVELIRDSGGGLGQTLSAERAATHGFSSVTVGPIPIGSGGAPLLAGNAHWPSGRHGGNLFWPVGSTSGNVAFAEPDHSLLLDRAPQVDGSVTLAAEAVNHTAGTSTLALLLGAVLPLEGGLTLGPVVELIPQFQLAPDETLAVSGNVPSLPDGLYVLALVDWADGAVLNYSSVWHRPETASGAMPQAADLALPEQNRFEVRRTIRAAGQRLRLAALGTSAGPQVFGADETASITLPSGDRVHWRRGALEIEVLGTRPAAVQLEPGEVEILTGAPSSCCDGVQLEWITRLTLEGAEHRAVELDGRPARPTSEGDGPDAGHGSGPARG